MKKWYTVDYMETQETAEPYDTAEEASAAALATWDGMSRSDRKPYAEGRYSIHVGLYETDDGGERSGDPEEVAFDTGDFLKIRVGDTYTDPEGEWEIVALDIASNEIEIENIQAGNPNQGREFHVTPYEVLFYLNGGK